METSNRHYRTLVIDDDPADRDLARIALAKSSHDQFDCTMVDGLADARESLMLEDFDVILLDLGLPESNGAATISRLREFELDVPVVVLTDLAESACGMEALSLGAQDYLGKGNLSTESLTRAIRYAVQRQSMTAEIAHANGLLAKKNDELARLCDTAQKFVDNVSHEFRTPLTVIKEYVSLLREGVVGTVQLDPEQCRFLDILADRADDLNTMVDDMLDVSKLEAGLLGAWRKTCRWEDIQRRLLPELRSKADIKDVSLEFESDDDLPSIYCDAEKLSRVVTNLVVNAIKFCRPPGRVLVEARHHQEANELVISVTDNGPGIDEEDLKTIFTRFRQLGTTSRGSCKGFGLGLNIARELIDVNLGELKVESHLGVGSTFSFTVPESNPREIVGRYLQRLHNTSHSYTHIVLLHVGVDVMEDDATPDEIDAFLNYTLRKDDVLLREAEREWLLLIPLESADLAEEHQRIEQMRVEANRNRPRGPLPPLALEVAGDWALNEVEAVIKEVDLLLESGGLACV